MMGGALTDIALISAVVAFTGLLACDQSRTKEQDQPVPSHGEHRAETPTVPVPNPPAPKPRPLRRPKPSPVAANRDAREDSVPTPLPPVSWLREGMTVENVQAVLASTGAGVARGTTPEGERSIREWPYGPHQVIRATFVDDALQEWKVTDKQVAQPRPIAPPAQPQRPKPQEQPVATLAKFERIQPLMVWGQVVQIMGFNGTLDSNYGESRRYSWKGGRPGSEASVWFEWKFAYPGRTPGSYIISEGLAPRGMPYTLVVSSTSQRGLD